MTIKEITLLSAEEYEKNRPLIPVVDDCWWLRSPGRHRYNITNVLPNGNVAKYGVYVAFDLPVRPALKLNLDPSDIFFWYKPEKLIGTKIEYGNRRWTVLNADFGETYVLCDDIIAKRCFDPESDGWNESELKQWLETEGLQLITT